jgi:hypothetical protein
MPVAVRLPIVTVILYPEGARPERIPTVDLTAHVAVRVSGFMQKCTGALRIPSLVIYEVVRDLTLARPGGGLLVVPDRRREKRAVVLPNIAVRYEILDVVPDARATTTRSPAAPPG